MRKARALKIIGIIVSVYLALFFAFVIPLHHHVDFTEHNDCVICDISHQPFISNVNFTIQLLLVLLFTFVFADNIIKIFDQTQFHLRSPPQVF
jgi:hypothetical protein